MELIISDRQEKYKVDDILIEKLKLIINECLEYEGFDLDYEVSLSFVDNHEIHSLNKSVCGRLLPPVFFKLRGADISLPRRVTVLRKGGKNGVV